MNSLLDICYEQIKDQYWYGKFGGFRLVIDKNTGYFNATKLCNSGGKRFRNWTRLDSSIQLIAYISSAHIRADEKKRIFYSITGGKRFRNWKRLDQSKQLITYYEDRFSRPDQGALINYVERGNRGHINKIISGQYVPKELILAIASWISIEFYDKCSNIVLDYFINEYKSKADLYC